MRIVSAWQGDGHCRHQSPLRSARAVSRRARPAPASNGGWTRTPTRRAPRCPTSRSPASTSPRPNTTANGTTPLRLESRVADAIVLAQTLSNRHSSGWPSLGPSTSRASTIVSLSCGGALGSWPWRGRQITTGPARRATVANPAANAGSRRRNKHLGARQLRLSCSRGEQRRSVMQRAILRGPYDQIDRRRSPREARIDVAFTIGHDHHRSRLGQMRPCLRRTVQPADAFFICNSPGLSAGSSHA